ncbi:MAG: hypothetical protein V1750_07465 [Acidobacteriota bacterium]
MTDRFRRWLTWLRMMLAALILIALAGSLALHLYGQRRFRLAKERFEAVTGPIELFVPARPVLSPDQNAATWLVAGSEALVWSGEERYLIGELTLKPFAAWSAAERETLRAVLNRNRATFEILRRAVPLAAADFGITYEEGVRAKLPPLLKLLNAARLLLLEARVALANGDPAAALAGLSIVSRLAPALEQERATIVLLVGISSERILLTVAAEATAAPASWAAEPAFLDALAATLPGTDLVALARQSMLDNGRAMLSTAGGSLPWGPQSAPERTGWRDKVGRYLFGGLRDAESLAVSLELAEKTSTPWGEEPGLFAPLPKSSWLWRLSSQMEASPKGLRAVAGRAQLALAQRQLVSTAIALRRQAATTGSYPSDRPNLPALGRPDPFTGKRLLYRPAADGTLQIALDCPPGLIEKLLPAATVVAITLPAPIAAP